MIHEAPRIEVKVDKDVVEIFNRLDRKVQRKVFNSAAKKALRIVRTNAAARWAQDAFPKTGRPPGVIRKMIASSMMVRTRSSKGSLTASCAVDYRKARSNRLATLIEWGWRVQAGFKRIAVTVKKVHVLVRTRRRARGKDGRERKGEVHYAVRNRYLYDKPTSRHGFVATKFRPEKLDRQGRKLVRTKASKVGQKIEGQHSMERAWEGSRPQVEMTFSEALSESVRETCAEVNSRG